MCTALVHIGVGGTHYLPTFAAVCIECVGQLLQVDLSAPISFCRCFQKLVFKLGHILAALPQK